MSELKSKKTSSTKKSTKEEVVKEPKTKKTEKKEVVKESKPKKAKTSTKESVKDEVIVKEVTEKKKRVTKKAESEKTLKKEEIKKDALLDKKSQKTLKLLSHIVSIVAKIIRVCAMIIVPIIFIIMILMPIIFKDVEISGNIVKYNDARFVINDDYITANIGNKSFVICDGIRNIDQVISFLNDNTPNHLLLSFEFLFGFYAIVLVINAFIFQYLEKLFDNIYRLKTPFIKDNCEYIHRIAKMMIYSLVVTVVLETILNLVCKDILSINIGTYGIIEIVCVYVVYYIFKYGINMQKEVDTTIYD